MAIVPLEHLEEIPHLGFLYYSPHSGWLSHLITGEKRYVKLGYELHFDEKGFGVLVPSPNASFSDADVAISLRASEGGTLKLGLWQERGSGVRRILKDHARRHEPAAWETLCARQATYSRPPNNLSWQGGNSPSVQPISVSARDRPGTHFVASPPE
jgi:hypothetical protein